MPSYDDELVTITGILSLERGLGVETTMGLEKCSHICFGLADVSFTILGKKKLTLPIIHTNLYSYNYYCLLAILNDPFWTGRESNEEVIDTNMNEISHGNFIAFQQ